MSGKMIQVMSAIGHGTVKAAGQMFDKLFAPKDDTNAAIVNMVRTRKQAQLVTRYYAMHQQIKAAVIVINAQNNNTIW